MGPNSSFSRCFGNRKTSQLCFLRVAAKWADGVKFEINLCTFELCDRFPCLSKLKFLLVLEILLKALFWIC